MSVWFIFFVIAALVAILLVVFIYSAHTSRKQRENAHYVQQAATLVQQPATVTGKTKQRAETGSVQVPSHRIAYMVAFRAGDAQDILLEVDEPLYDQFVIGASDTLITQNGRFVGFGDIGSTGSMPNK